MDAVPPPHDAPTVSIFSTDQHADSPKPLSPTWTGVLITAPASVIMGTAPTVVVVRGTYRIRGMEYPAKARWKLVVTDSVTNKSVSAEMGQRDPSPVDPDPEADKPIDPKTKARMTYVGHFNAELFMTTGIMPRPGSYIVRAELGPLKSNEIAVKILAK